MTFAIPMRKQKLCLPQEIGDWNCSYCDWKDVCYPQGIFTTAVENGTLTVDEALANYGIGA
jgi:hypothetical protein